MDFILPDGSTATSANDWAKCLKQAYQWKEGASAHALAHSWTNADGFPPKVKAVITAWRELADLEPDTGYVERETPMPAKGLPSCTDLLVIAESAGYPCVIAVEGKANERFGDATVAEWRKASPNGDNTNRENRLAMILQIIGLSHRTETIGTVRYQLLHRMAAAVIEATSKQHNAESAILLVHSFASDAKQKQVNESDYLAFLREYGAEETLEKLIPLGAASGIMLYAAWVSDTIP